jgi:ADP-ribosyl-[dinitrogen reductase] hydrolase
LDKHFYIKTIREIILEAGDTDTNAAIVGGLLGALVGFSNLPGEYLQIMLTLVFPEDS